MANHKISANNPDLLDLKELLSDANLKNPEKVLKSLFPSLDEDQYSAVAELSVAIILPRQRQHLGKALKWRPQKTAQGYQGLNKQEALKFLKAVKELAASMPAEWNKISADELSLDWKRASVAELPNSELWRNSLAGRGLFEAPNFTQGDGFSLEVYPAVVNPDNVDQVWSIGSAVPLDQVSVNGKISPQAWAEYLTTNKDKLEEEFGFANDPRVLKPTMRLFWRITAPDGETFSLPRTLKDQWRQNANAKAWINDRKIEIEASYAKAALWCVNEMYNAATETKNQRITNDVITPRDWDLFDQKPARDLADFDRMMEEMEKTNPRGAEKIKASIVSIAPTLMYHKKSWAQKRWVIAQDFRDQVASRPFLSDDHIENFISGEQRSFIEEAAKYDIVDYASGLTDAQKMRFLDILHWNDCNVPANVLNILTNNQVEEVVIEEKTPIKTIAQNKHSRVDWGPLLNSFGIDPTSTEVESQVFDNHPFANWMMRLSPPKEVVEATLSWIEENEVFNDINRSILHKKDSDESALNIELMEKLNKVITTSNQIIEDSRQSGGWWGRVRKNMSQQQGPTSEQWADVYLEFQEHMTKMLDEINTQVERDKTWLRYADGIKTSSQKVDSQWQKWLTETAERLSQEREQLQDTVTSERKIQWNNEANTLESAQSAYQHIKTANGIGHVLLEKVRQSVGVKERLQQRSTMFYWSSLNMFAGLQSLQRNTNGVGEQSELVEEMGKALQGGFARSLAQEAEQKEKIREAFKNMAQSEEGMKKFYETMAAFQRDTVAIISDMSASRGQLQEDAAEAISLSSTKVKEKLKAQQVAVEIPTPPSKTSSTGPF